MKTPERTATWRRKRVVLRVSRLTWRLEQAERECARALARPTRRESRSARWRPQPGSPRPGCTRSRPGGPGRAGCRAGGAAGRGLAGARRLSALSRSAQQRYWRHADHSLWPVVQVSESHRENVQNGGSARGYQELSASLAAGQTRLRSRWPGHQGRIFIHRRSYRERTHLPRSARLRRVVGLAAGPCGCGRMPNSACACAPRPGRPAGSRSA
jgi:hypothetical protein